MAVPSISYIVGAFFAFVGIVGIALNTTVLFAIHKGRLLSSKASPVYILSSQTLVVDALLVLAHLIYHAPAVALQRDIIPTELEFIFEFVLMYGWFHNSLSHILIALNRLVVIVFKRTDVFTRKRTIALSILHHLVASALSIATEFMLPCCKLRFSWRAYSYAYDELPGISNYSAILTIPIETASSLVSIVSYAVIIRTMHNARKIETMTRDIDKKRRVQEYRYAIQFAVMALVYSTAWILFNTLPILIGKTTDLYIYAFERAFSRISYAKVITMLVEINALANATVYLSNNKEIQKSIQVMLGNSSKIYKKMAADLTSYLMGGFFATIAIIGLIMNTTVLLAIFKGGLLSSKTSPVYILSSQTMAMDTILILVHLLYLAPEVLLQYDVFPPFVDALCDFLLMYCWFHNSLSHILIALNRLFVIVFKRLDLFTHRRTIVLCVVHHIVAIILAASTEFLMPCCRLSFSWAVFSYSYRLEEGVTNYAAAATIPVDIASSLTSILSYAAIIWTMHSSRRVAVQLDTDKKRRHQEYRYAIQFAVMALVYSLAWILFNTFPIMIGNTSAAYVYGVVAVLVLINTLANATVYLTNNKEIQNSIRMMVGRKSKVFTIQDVTTHSSKTEHAMTR
ncbi:hypothetical protein PRIPAC_82986 [Pristionchus pacificus]|uniref:G protein-coupled receptor n=1 Tax=Pristionchus pacificus TaxID=54126 RepID=A0A2A6CK54_PRIPA|nr:hypothetical protein PRIPAC_82986 [Pristionchus pacificus]|eukprot:PDM78468.1 G protein-coupled receptor [Pristionchus pacificus]